MLDQKITTISLINTNDCIITPCGIMTKNPTKLVVNDNHLQIIGKPLDVSNCELTSSYYGSAHFLKKYIFKPILNPEPLDNSQYKDKHLHRFDLRIKTFNLSNLSTYNCSTNLIEDDILVNVDNESNFFLIDTSKKMYPKIKATITASSKVRIFVQSMGNLEMHVSDGSEITLFLSHSENLNILLDKDSKATIQAINRLNHIDNLQVKATNSSHMLIKSTISKIVHSIYLDHSDIVFDNCRIKRIKKKSVNNNSCYTKKNVNKNG